LLNKEIGNASGNFPTGFIGWSFFAAPMLLFFYGIAHWADGRDGSYGPGLAWTLGHILFLLGLVMFIPVILGLWLWLDRTGLGRRFAANLSAVLAIIGLVIFIRVPIIDILSGLLAQNQTAMGEVSTRLNSYPFAGLGFLYNFGPLLFQLGLLALMLQLAILKPRRLPWWSPALLLLGFLMLGFNLNLLPVGAIIIGCAFTQILFVKNTSTNQVVPI
jgi:hypothetical protein